MVVLSEDIARGVVDETRAVGILEQWLIEGKLEPEDALTQACDLLSAGLDTVSVIHSRLKSLLSLYLDQEHQYIPAV